MELKLGHSGCNLKSEGFVILLSFIQQNLMIHTLSNGRRYFQFCQLMVKNSQ